MLFLLVLQFHAIKYDIPWIENVHLKRSITADEVMLVIGIPLVHFQ